jgi:tricorn protease
VDARRAIDRLRVDPRHVGAERRAALLDGAGRRRGRVGDADAARLPGKISPDGKRIAYRMNNSWDDERRNYRGGQNRPIWIMDLASHEVETPTWTDSKDLDPVWIGSTVYFLSDRDGVQNVWAHDGKDRPLRQLTRFTDFDVKTLDAGGGVLVFEQAGYLHELDPATGRSKIVPITAAGDFPWMMPQWKDVGARMTDLALSPTGRRAAVEARGEIFTIPAEKGDVRNLTNASGSAEIGPVWSPDGRSVAYFSDRSGEYRLYVAPQEGMAKPREIALPEPSRPYAPAWSPDGRRIAYQDSHLRLWVLDVASGRATLADTDPHFSGSRTIVPVWSPDSRWVAYPKRLPSLYRAIFLYDVEGGQKRQVTDGLADATQPAWDASGKYLWFMASTNFAMNSGLLDMSAYEHATTRGLYLMVLAKGEPSPLLPESDEEAARAGRAQPQPGRDMPPSMPPSDSSNAAPAAGTRTAAAPRDTAARAAAIGPRSTTVRIDFDGLQQRIIAVQDLAIRDYGQLRAGAPGTVFFVESVPQTGTSDPQGGGGGTGGTLHRYQLTTRRATPFATNVAQYVVSADGRKLLYRTPGQQAALFLVDADRAAPAGAAAGLAAGVNAAPAGAGTPAAGRLNATLRAYIDPKAEFAQIFAEGVAQPAQQLLRQEPARHRLAGDAEDVRAAAGAREPPRGPQLPHGHDGGGDRDRALVRARRRHARGADVHRRAAGRRLHGRGRPLPHRAHLRRRELEPGPARAAGDAGREREAAATTCWPSTGSS